MSQSEVERLTMHALLVAWGQYAQCIGLPQELETVPLRQKTVTHSPQTKILEFLVSILGGLEHLKDISRSAHPMDQDQEVARAWGQPAWADYSGVSRTLSGLSMEEAEDVVAVLDRISQPIIRREVFEAQQRSGKIIYDGDLTGRPVSKSSTTYPGVAYGHMDDGIYLGYQAALVSMESPTYGRLWLSATPHPGNTLSCTQAQAMVLEAERQTGVHPLRRTDLLCQRIAGEQARLAELEARAALAAQNLADCQADLMQAEAQLQDWQARLAELETAYTADKRPERPYSKPAKARNKVGVYQRRCARRLSGIEKAQRILVWRQGHVADAQTECDELQARLAQLEHDNATNRAPIQAEFRLDAGFGTKENIMWLIEMGYEVYTKPHNTWLENRLVRLVDDHTVWTQVSPTADLTAWMSMALDDFPYPLNLALERFHLSTGVRHSILVHFGDTPAAPDLHAWFAHYNQRQTIEAGIKEGKQTFQMHHLKVRSQAALFLQEHFAAFAANFVRWATLWLVEQNPDLPDAWQHTAQLPIKELVAVAAHTSAYVTWLEQGCLLRFSDLSFFAGRSLSVKRQWAYQPVLPFTESFFFSSA